MQYVRYLFVGMVLWILVSVTSNGFATILEPKFDRHLVKEAQLIFQGTVTAVEYKESSGDGKMTDTLIHTFVTFTVDHIFKGDILTGNTMTLRFQGGLKPDNTIMEVDGIPLFDLGDRYVLFAKDNESAPCPLVGWNQGLFRIINKQELYSNSGHSLVLADNLDIVSLFVKSDILKPNDLIARLKDSKMPVDQIMREFLGQDTRNIMDVEYANDPALTNILIHLLIRDFNTALQTPALFSDALVESLSLRDDTRDFWKMNRQTTNRPAVMRLNRMILEDAYDGILLKSLNQILAWGRYTALDEVLTHAYNNDIRFRLQSSGADKNQVYVIGKSMTLNDLYEHITKLIGLVTTPTELKALPHLINSDSTQKFTIPIPEPVAPPENYDQLLGIQ